MSQQEHTSREFLRKILQNQTENYSLEMLTRRSYLTRERVDKPVIYIGMATCGIVAGAVKTYQFIQKYILEREIDVELVKIGCIGLCSAEPVVDIQLPGHNRLSFKNITEEKVQSLLDDVLHKTIPTEMVLGQFDQNISGKWKEIPSIWELPFYSNQNRIVLNLCGIVDPVSIDEYIAWGGYKAFVKSIGVYTHEDICNIIDKSKLRGRAGGGFPTGEKWKTAYHTPADEKYLICNAQESDPGAFMDRTIIESNPHRLIEGMAIAAYAIGASKAYIYVRAEYKIAIERLEESIKQARELGLLGDNIFNSGYNLNISVKKGPGAFVCGEETALIGSIEGRRGMPRSKPPYPSTTGLNDKPTIINNVESLSNVPEIIQNGPEWFNSIGTENSKGTKIFAISGNIKYTGLMEVPMGTSIRDLVYNIAGGIPNGKKFKALLIGGPSGFILSSGQLDTTIDFESMKSIGAGIGSGGLVVVDEDTCIVDLTKFLMDFMQKQSCGKCIPCREGTKRMLEIFEGITKKPASDNGHTTLERFKGVMQLESIADVMKDASLCGLGQNAPNPVLTALKWFREEFEEHIFDRNCKATVCKELRRYIIKVDECTGCTLCAKKCPETAIIGTQHSPFFIVEEKCTGCGICYEVCKFNAIEIK